MTKDEVTTVKNDLDKALQENIKAMQKCQVAALTALAEGRYELAHTMMFKVREEANRSVNSLTHWVSEFKKQEIEATVNAS